METGSYRTGPRRWALPSRVISLVWTTSMLFGASPAAVAHHAASEYDYQKVVEIAGSLKEVRWSNPHVKVFVQTGTDATGKPVILEIEGGALSVMRRTNATPAGLRVGDRVRVAGHPSRKKDTRMYGLNLLQADGNELLFHAGLNPRWRNAALGSVSNWYDDRNLEKSNAGIFRVWSSRLNGSLTPSVKTIPFTEAAKKRIAAWDPLNDAVVRGCESSGMPTVMGSTYPMEFVRKDANTILLRLELHDTVRTIHMDKSDPATLPKHALGRSIGHWENGTLVVKTDGILWRYLNLIGTPLGSAATVDERFTPAADGSRLEYKMVVTDPEYLEQPLELTRTWIARAGEALKPYECKAD